MTRDEDYLCRWCPYQAPIPSLKTQHEARCPERPTKENPDDHQHH